MDEQERTPRSLLLSEDAEQALPNAIDGAAAARRLGRMTGAALLGAAVLLVMAAVPTAPVAHPRSPAMHATAAVSLANRGDEEAAAEELDIAEPDRDLTALMVSGKDSKESKASKCGKTSTSDGSPSLFCWSLVTLGDMEEGLLKGIYTGRAGIFACNDYAVISRERALIGEDGCGEPYYTWQVDMPKTLPRGHFGVDAETNSFLNVKVFMDCWQVLFNSGKIWENDFSVKADSDAVIFPDRIRSHVAPHKGKAVFFTNCRFWGGDQVGQLFGALEVFSKQAMGVYHDKNGTCMGLPWQRWGEDMYMQKCMDAIGVQTVGDFKMTADTSCPLGGSPDCGQRDIAAFHPHKDGQDWWNCWKTANGIDITQV